MRRPGSPNLPQITSWVDAMDLKLAILHGALLETARLSHPRLGHKLDPASWIGVLGDENFQSEYNALLAKQTKKGLFAKPSGKTPTPEDYKDLGQKHADSLSRWEKWGSVRALFHALDAEVALQELTEGPFLSELVADVLLEDMTDQVERGYLKL